MYSVRPPNKKSNDIELKNKMVDILNFQVQNYKFLNFRNET